MIIQLVHLPPNPRQVRHLLLRMSIHFLLPRSLFLLNFSIDADRFLLKMYISIYIYTMSVCVSRLALYIRFFFFYMCLSSKLFLFFSLLSKPCPIIALLLFLSTGRFWLLMMNMLVFEVWWTHIPKKTKIQMRARRYIYFLHSVFLFFLLLFPVFLLLRLCILRFFFVPFFSLAQTDGL